MRTLFSRTPPIVLLLMLALAACTSREAPLDTSSPADQEVQVSLNDNYTITASPATVRAGRVKFTITNRGTISHGFAIQGQGLEQNIAPGASSTRETRMPSGPWILYCPVADHRERGMQIELKVD